jgi:hypothetical protein
MRFHFHHTVAGLAILGCAASACAQAVPEVPQKVSVCELLENRKAWDHKLVQVSGIASHDFEDSGFFSDECKSRYDGLWMAYGGTKTTRTTSTVNEQNPTRSKPLEVEGVKVPLVQDAVFFSFDGLLHPSVRQEHAPTVHATVIARFFAGRIQHYPKGDLWGGYGHLGCCSLFVVQQVLSVDEPAK